MSLQCWDDSTVESVTAYVGQEARIRVSIRDFGRTYYLSLLQEETMGIGWGNWLAINSEDGTSTCSFASGQEVLTT